jgi:hypothetical protein
VHGPLCMAIGPTTSNLDLLCGADRHLILFTEVVFTVPCAMCHVPCAMCHVPCAMCHVPCAMCHVPCAMCHVPCAMPTACVGGTLRVTVDADVDVVHVKHTASIDHGKQARDQAVQHQLFG